MAARSKAWVCGRCLACIAGSKPTWGKDVLSLMSVVCCQVEISAAERSLVQRITTECGVSVSDLETSTMMQPRPTSAVEQIEKISHFPRNVKQFFFYCEVGNKSINLDVCNNNINNQVDATMTDFIDNYNQLSMFRAIISPILRSTRLCLQLVV